MNKALSWIFGGILIVITVVIAGYFYFIYSMGSNFVHDRPASAEYYNHIANRIGFTTKYRGDKFNVLLDSFLKANPQYSSSEGVVYLPENDSCSCNCFQFKRYIHFNSPPKEAYLITYDSGAGVLDIVFSYKNDKWVCTKSSKLDSIEKSRIKNRFDTAILNKIK